LKKDALFSFYLYICSRYEEDTEKRPLVATGASGSMGGYIFRHAASYLF
jgi:hypothetical protein